eukprot:TRINITY_DN6350_c1_g1_i2.p1 TRINITY_DN6350_c1_g1~~TRINITY_DN6350_c1_g1_i2.p1  ORF type:complete len:262 (+),score=67.11 TRINITY_DN6350_c1_g1_i2:97-882(+)
MLSGSDLYIVVALGALLGPDSHTCLVSQAFHTLSRNCKYFKKKQAPPPPERLVPHSACGVKALPTLLPAQLTPTPVYCLPASPSSRSPQIPAQRPAQRWLMQLLQSCDQTPAIVTVCPRPDAPPAEQLPVLLPPFPEPVLVDECSVPLALAGSNNSLPLVLAALIAAVPRLSNKPTIVLAFLESSCFVEFMQYSAIMVRKRKRPQIPLRRHPVVQQVNGEYIIFVALDCDEFPVMFTKCMNLLESPYWQDGRVRLRRCIIY